MEEVAQGLIALIQEATAAGAQEASQGINAAGWSQIASAVGTLILAVAVWLQIREARKQVAATRETVEEMRESRRAQERPQVIVDTDHSNPPFVFVVVRNIGKGPAKNISFEFSNDMESPESANPHSLVKPVNKQPYFERGIDYLAPGAEIPCLWGSMINLAQFLRDRGLQDGITVTSRYASLDDEVYETEWTVNPLLVASRVRLGSEKSVEEVAAEALKKIAETFSEVVHPIQGELRVSTEAERQQRKQLLEELRDFLKEKRSSSGADDLSEVRISRSEIEAIGQNPHTAAKLFELYTGRYWFGDFDTDETGEWRSFQLMGVM